MAFNSFEFALFLTVVFAGYWTIRSFRAQNVLLLAASYFFYGWWDYRFLALLALSSVIDFAIGPAIAAASTASRRKLLLAASLAMNLGMLGVFKYCDFFVDSLVQSLQLLGIEASASRLGLILPAGISFYTFQTLSYSIDIYRGRIQPTRDFVAFMAFVSFFPQLVAGPIERAEHLLPQFLEPRRFDYQKAVDGMRQILCGLFKKLVIADNCAACANLTFDHPNSYSGMTLALGAVCFAWQIYGDFSGYSDIAIGSSRLFGFSLMQNFACPYFSRDIAEFWRRWHISLSTWFRDYVYLPLGGSRCPKWKMIRNTLIVFLVSGLWHGANWTFVVWGLLNALYFLPLQLAGANRRHVNSSPAVTAFMPSRREAAAIAATFCLTTLAWVFFRADSVTAAVGYLARIFTMASGSQPSPIPSSVLITVTLFAVLEWSQRHRAHVLEFTEARIPRPVRWLLYYGIIVLTVAYTGEKQEFIYFQF